MNELLEALTKDLELLEIKKTPKYLVLKLPVSKIYDKEYWQEVNQLNKKDFEKLGILVIIENTNSKFPTGIFLTIDATENYPNVEETSFQSCKFNEVEKMQKYYELAQRLLEIEGGVK